MKMEVSMPLFLSLHANHLTPPPFLPHTPLTPRTFQGFSCSDHKVCKHGGQCVGETALNSICSLRNSFWGTSALKAPSAMEHGQRIEEELRMSFNARDKTFSFQVKGRDVCERGYLILLGLITRESLAPRQWIRVKKELEEGEEGGRPVGANVVDDDKSVADIETGYLEELAEGVAMEVEQLGDAGEPVSAAADDAENDFL
jgi:hypothetical protein